LAPGHRQTKGGKDDHEPGIHQPQSPAANSGNPGCPTDGQVLIARKGKKRFVYISPLFRGTGIDIDLLKPLAKKALARL
jgi:hypothetical protein